MIDDDKPQFEIVGVSPIAIVKPHESTFLENWKINLPNS